MKKSIILLLSIVMTITVWAQKTEKTITPTKFVAEFIPQEKLEAYLTEKSQKILDMNYFSENYCFVTNQIPENSQVIATLSSAVKGSFPYNPNQILKDKEINPFFFDLLQDNTKYNIYTIANSKFVVAVRPLTEYEQGKADYFKQNAR